MLRLLRWGTFIVLILVFVGAAFSYPILRERVLAPTAVAPAVQLPVFAPVALVQIESPTARATMPIAQVHATRPAVIIAAPSPSPDIIPSSHTPTIAPPPSTTPAAIATTSLLPVALSSVIPVVTTTSVVTPFTPESVAADVTPILIIPMVVDQAEISPTASIALATAGVITATAGIVTSTAGVVVTDELTPPAATPTPQPVGPTANIDSPLYDGPDFNAPTVGQVFAGEPLTIVGLYTEGNWYLLVRGTWIPGTAVDNAPLTMPLVFPTMTPVPSATPTITFTPLPVATLVGSPTPTPTATSLDEAVCDCSGDTRDCLGNIFANRAEAQRCFEYCFRQTGRDIHLLDPNLNGVACENLP